MTRLRHSQPCAWRASACHAWPCGTVGGFSVLGFRYLAALAALLTATACDSESPADDAPVIEDTQVSTATDTSSPDTETPDVVLPPGELKPGVKAIVSHIYDGDTVDLDVGSSTFRVRLRGLAAPECSKGQRKSIHGDFRSACAGDEEFYGLASYQELYDMVRGKEVIVTCDQVLSNGWCPQDDFERYLVYLQADGRDAATQMAWLGAAFSYTSFHASKLAQICAAEYDARSNKRGMWAAGTVGQVIGMMSPQTQNWYNRYHDDDCDEALE